MTAMTDRLPIDASKYSYSVIWSDEDQCHVGLCAEFPSMSFLVESQSEALAGITRLIADTLADMRRVGETVPDPHRPHRSADAQILVRLPVELHIDLLAEAVAEGISLNQHCCDLLSKRSG